MSPSSVHESSPQSHVWRKSAAALGLLLTLAMPSAFAQVGTLTSETLEFDSFVHAADPGQSLTFGGFNWGSKWWNSSDLGQPLTFDNGLGTSSLISRTDGTKFVFDGATFWKRAADKNIDVTVSLFDSGSTAAVWTNTFRLEPRTDAHGVDTRTFLNSGYSGLVSFMTVAVDRGTVRGNDQNYLAMDTFRVQTNTGVVSTVPEPHTTAMLLAGLGMIGVMGRRRQQHKAQSAQV
jgi:PEP-CTERM motif